MNNIFILFVLKAKSKTKNQNLKQLFMFFKKPKSTVKSKTKNKNLKTKN